MREGKQIEQRVWNTRGKGSILCEFVIVMTFALSFLQMSLHSLSFSKVCQCIYSPGRVIIMWITTNLIPLRLVLLVCVYSRTLLTSSLSLSQCLVVPFLSSLPLPQLVPSLAPSRSLPNSIPSTSCPLGSPLPLSIFNIRSVSVCPPLSVGSSSTSQTQPSASPLTLLCLYLSFLWVYLCLIVYFSLSLSLSLVISRQFVLSPAQCARLFVFVLPVSHTSSAHSFTCLDSISLSS